MSIELKPCPFCGGEAAIERLGTRRFSTIYQCQNCSCSLETGEEWDHGADWNVRATDARIAALEEALRSVKPLVEQAEYLLDCAYSYGPGYPEPSPCEWGISIGFQQTRDLHPHAQYLEEVEKHHRNNREEDDGDGEFLTAANKIRALLEGKP